MLYIPDYPANAPRSYLLFKQRGASEPMAKTWARHVADLALGEPSELDFAELRDHYLNDFRKRIGSEFAEDALQDLMLAVLANIENGDFQVPGRLVLLVQKSLADVTAEYKERARARRFREKGFNKARKVADLGTALDQRLGDDFRAFIQQSLNEMGPQAREVLERLYVREESPTEIQVAMKLTPRDFAALHRMSKTALQDRILIKRRAGNRGLVPWVRRLSVNRPHHGSKSHWGLPHAEPIRVFPAATLNPRICPKRQEAAEDTARLME